MKVRKIALIALAVLLAGCGGATANSDSQPQNTTQSQNTSQSSENVSAGCRTGAEDAGTGEKTSELPTVTIHASCGEKVMVRVEIADNPLGRYIGLRGRESMPEGRGMLFVYPAEAPRTFTMANTPLPLSIAFIDSERRIIDIQDMKPLDGEPPGYDSAEPAQYALEVNQGFFEKRGVKVGDRVELPE
jgi:uncharacterized membrane protein (UPF0127 family)